MRISHTVMMVTAGVFTPLFTAFALDTLRVMLPWQIAMACIIVADLVAGVRKSLKLGVHVSWSTAFRETMGKIVVYFAWTSAAAVVDVAAHSDTSIVKWACLLVCAIEGGSILSNILKPHGVELSLKAILKYLLVHSPLHADPHEAEEIVDAKRVEEIRARERERWARQGGRRRERYGARVSEIREREADDFAENGADHAEMESRPAGKERNEL